MRSALTLWGRRARQQQLLAQLDARQVEQQADDLRAALHAEAGPLPEIPPSHAATLAGEGAIVTLRPGENGK